MEVLLNGVGDAFSAKHWGTNFVVRHQGFHLAVDCPDSYRRSLAENAFEMPDGGTLDVGDLDGLFLTHLHGDHVNGLEMTLAFRMFVTRRPLTVYTTPEVAKVLWSHRLSASLGTLYDGTRHVPMTFESFGELVVVDWDTPTEIGPLTITTRQTLHHIPTAALRFEANGQSLGYSCDTAYDETLLDWLDSSDLILHESSHGPAHTALSALESLPSQVRDRLVVVHYGDEVEAANHDLRFGIEGEILRF